MRFSAKFPYHKHSLSTTGLPKTGLCAPKIRPVPLTCKRASLRIFKKASLTVESTFMIPIFMMMVICITSIMNLYPKTLDQMVSIRNKCEQSAVIASASGAEFWFDISVPMTFRPLYAPASLANSTVWVRGRVRLWNGREEGELDGTDGGAPEYVYLAENASVYHTSSDCTHIHLSVHAADAADLTHLHNASGGKYSPCEKCAGHGSPEGTVYVTDQGTRYHTDPDCSGIKRTVRMVEASEAEGMKECEKCASKAS